jgi:hypothetical protein
MFNPERDDEHKIYSTWTRHSCRTVFLTMREYFRKISDCRINLEENEPQLIPGDAFPQFEVTESRVDDHFVAYFIREMYKVGNDVDHYPNTFNGEIIDRLGSPVVFLTRKKLPKLGLISIFYFQYNLLKLHFPF